MPPVIMDLVGIIASLLRVVGFLVLGVGLTWIMLYLLKQEGKPWYFQAILFTVFFGFFAVVIWRVNPAGSGALALGAGGGLLFWGPRAMKGGESLAVPQVSPISSAGSSTVPPEPKPAPAPAEPEAPARRERKIAKKEE